MEAPRQDCLITLRSLLPSMSKVHRGIAEQILKDPEGVIGLSVTELADRTNASEASVVLLCKKLGCRGFHDFKIRLADELYHSSTDIHEDIEHTDGAPVIIEKVFNTTMQALKDTRQILRADALCKAAEQMVSAKKILVMGIGISGMIARDFWMKLVRLSFNVNVYDDQTTMKMAAVLAEPGDAVFVISHSGSTKVIIDILAAAKQRGAATIGLTNYLNSPITRHLDTLLLTSSRESGVREEEMTARIAQLAVIDALFVTIANQRYAESAEALKKTREALSSDKL